MIYNFEHKISIKTEGKILRALESESSKDLTSKVQKIPMNLQPYPTLAIYSKGEKSLWRRTNTPSQKGMRKDTKRKSCSAKKNLFNVKKCKTEVQMGKTLCGTSCQRNIQYICIKINECLDKQTQILLLVCFSLALYSSNPSVTQFLPRSAQQKAAYPLPRQTAAGLCWKDLCSV